MYQTRGTRGEQGFRVARDEPANDCAHAGAQAGKDCRFPPAPPINKKATLEVAFLLVGNIGLLAKKTADQINTKPFDYPYLQYYLNRHKQRLRPNILLETMQ